MSQFADVLIVGGGIIGLAVARCLSKAHNRIVVIERNRVGQEASWAAAGMLAPHCENETLDDFFALCRASLTLYPDFIRTLQEETGMDVDFRTDGILYPALDDSDQQKLEHRHRRLRDAEVRVQYLSAKEARRLEPNLSNAVQMALLFQDDWQVDNRKLIHALAVSAQRAGVEILEDRPVSKILTEGDRVVGVMAGGERWQAGTVVNAAGSWARYLSGVPAASCPPVRPVRGQMVVLDADGFPLFRRVVYSSKVYMAPKTDGRLLVGSTVEEAGFRKAVTGGGMWKLMSGALRVAPSLKSHAVVSMWSGLRPATPDRLPILGPSSCEGLILATGHYRNGILLAPLTGQLIAELIRTNTVPSPMRPFLLTRFYTQTERMTS